MKPSIVGHDLLTRAAAATEQVLIDLVASLANDPHKIGIRRLDDKHFVLTAEKPERVSILVTIRRTE